MSADRLLDVLSLAILVCVGIAGLTRAVALARQGVWVLPIDRGRSAPQTLLDLAFVLGLAGWLYLAIAAALAADAQPGWLGLRWLGLATAVGGLVLYVRALRDFGVSWRFTIDRERAGDLVTTGVFARTRNPVYLALLLVSLGVSLALGRTVLVLFAGVAAGYLELLIRREERFLAAHYGEAYEAYRARVPRWL